MKRTYTHLLAALFLLIGTVPACERTSQDSSLTEQQDFGEGIVDEGNTPASPAFRLSLLQLKADSLLKQKEYAEVLRLLKEEPEDIADLYSLNQQAVAFLRLRDYQSALHLLKAADSLLTETPDLHGVLAAEHCLTYGEYWYRLRTHKKAITCFDKALSHFRTVYGDEHEKMAICYSWLGMTYRYRLNDPLNAERSFLKELEVIRKEELSARERVCFYNLATTYRLKNQYEKGIAFGLTAYRLAKEENNELSEIQCLSMLGNLYGDAENYDKAVGHYDEAIRKVLKTGINQRFLFRYYLQRGNFLSRKKDYRAADRSIRQGMEMTGKEEFDQLLECYSTLGFNFANQLKADSAKYYYSSALQLARQIAGSDDPWLSGYYVDYAWALRLDQQADSALVYIQKALAVISSTSLPPSSYDNPLLSALRTREDANLILGDKGVLLKQLYRNDPDDHLLLERSFQAFQLADSLMLDSRSFKEESASLHDLQHYHQIYGQAVETAADLYDRTHSESYLEAVSQFMDRSKAVVLYTSILGREQSGSRMIPQNLYEQEQKIKAALEQAHLQTRQTEVDHEQERKGQNKEILRLLQRQDSLAGYLGKHYPSYYESKYAFDVPDLKSVRQRLQKEQSQILQYHWSDSLLQGMLIKADTAIYFRSENTAGLTRNLRSYQEAVSSPPAISADENDPEVFTAASEALFAGLIGPVATWLDNDLRLVIIPDGPLAELPFEALSRSEGANGEVPGYPSGSYLLEDYSIRYAYSVKTFMKPGHDPSIRKVLAVGYSDGGEGSLLAQAERSGGKAHLPDLPGSIVEVEGLQNIVGSKRCLLLKGKEATKNNFLSNAAQADIIHLAVHALADLSNPYDNRIFFRKEEGAERESSVLYANDLYTLGLRAKLVVLSACQTARGRNYQGEGVYSLGRTFAYAGVPSLVMSLWPVSDRSSAEIMIDFYRQLDKGKSKDEALQQAKLRYLRKADELLAHPYFWAAFILSGDGSPVRRSWWF